MTSGSRASLPCRACRPRPPPSLSVSLSAQVIPAAGNGRPPLRAGGPRPPGLRATAALAARDPRRLHRHLPLRPPRRLARLRYDHPALPVKLLLSAQRSHHRRLMPCFAGRCRRLSKADRLLMCWWAFTGLTHIIIEGPFVFTPDFFTKHNPNFFDEVCKLPTTYTHILYPPHIDAFKF